MASMAADSGDINTAMEHYLQVFAGFLTACKWYALDWLVCENAANVSEVN